MAWKHIVALQPAPDMTLKKYLMPSYCSKADSLPFFPGLVWVLDWYITGWMNDHDY